MDKAVKNVSINDLIYENVSIKETDYTIKREILGFIIDQRITDGFVRMKDIRAIVNLYEFYKQAYGVGFHGFLEMNESFLSDLKKCGETPYTKIDNDIWIHPVFAIKILLHYYKELEVCDYKCLFDYVVVHLYYIARTDDNPYNYNRSGDVYVDVFKYYKHGDIEKQKKELDDILNTKIAPFVSVASPVEYERATLLNLILFTTNVFKDSHLGVKIGSEIYSQQEGKNFFANRLVRIMSPSSKALSSKHDLN